MSNVFSKIKTYAGRAAFIVGLSLVVFFSVFYALNLDLAPEREQISGTDELRSANLEKELTEKLGPISIGMESYGGWAERFNLAKANAGLDADPDKDELPNYLEYVHGTNPLQDDTDGDNFSDKQELSNGYDPDAPGDAKPAVEISIAKANVAAPMIWAKSEVEKDMLKELENGVGHYLKTAAPGQIGNAVIYGHSSNYIWAKGGYNHIFKDLNNLEKGDIATARVIQKNGRNISYSYKILEKFVAAPDDEKIFADTETPTLTLSTCWPLGTTFRRLIVKAELVK